MSYIQATKPNIPILPMIQNAVEGAWDGKGLARLLADPAARAARIKDIVALLDKDKFQGLTIDFEEVPAEAQKNLQLPYRDAAAFAGHGLSSCLPCRSTTTAGLRRPTPASPISCCSWATTSIGRRAPPAASPARAGSRKLSTSA